MYILWRRRWWWLKYFQLCHLPTWETRVEFQVLPLAWLRSSCCGHLETESTDDSSLSLSTFLIKKGKKPTIFYVYWINEGLNWHAHSFYQNAVLIDLKMYYFQNPRVSKLKQLSKEADQVDKKWNRNTLSTWEEDRSKIFEAAEDQLNNSKTSRHYLEYLAT